MKTNSQHLLTEMAARPWAINRAHLRALTRRAANYETDLPAASLLEVPDVKAGDDPGYTLLGDVAVFEIVGTILKEVPWIFAVSGCAATSTDAVRSALNAALQDETVASILLYVDSPGGTVDGVQELGDAIYTARSRKPIHAMVSDLCCSAGYWLASQANTVSANATAAIGSIGVYAVIEDWSRHYENAGVHINVISSGGVKGAGIEGAPITDEQLKDIQNEIDALVGEFIAAVARGRGMSEDKVHELATGQVWIGAQAIKVGLVDEIANSDVIVERLIPNYLTLAAKGEPMAWFSKKKAAPKADDEQEKTVAEPSRVTLLNPDVIEPNAAGIAIESQAEDAQPDEAVYNCECLDCGHKFTLKNEHCDDAKCAECGKENCRRVERPGPGQKTKKADEAKPEDGQAVEVKPEDKQTDEPAADARLEELYALADEFGADLALKAAREGLSRDELRALQVEKLEAELKGEREGRARAEKLLDEHNVLGEGSPVETGETTETTEGDGPPSQTEQAVGKNLAGFVENAEKPR